MESLHKTSVWNPGRRNYNLILTVVWALVIAILAIVSILVAIVVTALVVANGFKNIRAWERNLLFLIVVLSVALILVLVLVEPRSLLVIGIAVLI